MFTQMAIESFEDNLFWAAWNNIAKPKVEQLLDSMYGEPSKGDWVNETLRESTSFVIQMASQMAYMSAIRHQDKIFEVLDKVYHRLKTALLAVYGKAKDYLKNKIKSLRGVRAKTLYDNYGKGSSEHIEAQKLQAAELNNIISARQASSSSINSLAPAAQSVSYTLDKKNAYSDLAYKRGSLMFKSFEAKSQLGAWSADDVNTLKKVSNPQGGGTQNIKLDDLKDLQGIHSVKASNGTYLGRAALDFALLSYFGFTPPKR